MKFKGSPLYIQRQTNQMLQSHREFFRAYMNNIIIFSKTLNEHVKHFRKIFQLFQKRRVNLASTKFYLRYPFITLLGQKMNNLKLSITAEKIAAIILLQFSASLRKLKYFLKLIDWLRHCIERFVQLTQPLQVRKTSIIKQLTTNAEANNNKSSDSAKKKQSSKLILEKITNEKKESFARLQKIFFSSIFLVHFDSNRKLYIDLNAFKRWKFVVMIYHVVDDSKDGNFPRTAVQPILFFSKLLNGAEKNYWFTKLKVVEIVWIIKHVRHIIDFIKRSPTIIYTNHSAAMSIFKQTSLATFNTDKLNLRLIRASQYLSSFNIVIRHKASKINVISNALSRLSKKSSAQSDSSDKIEVLDALYDYIVDLKNHESRTVTIQNLSAIFYHVTLIEISNNFKQRFKDAYVVNKHWKKMLKVITSRQRPSAVSEVIGERQPSDAEEISTPPSTKIEKSLRGIRFRLKDELVYYISKTKKKDRLCISAFMKQKIFRVVYDLNSHSGFHRIYDRLINSVYIRQLTKRLTTYIDYCSECQLNQIKRHSPYESLQPIATSAISFHIIVIDFILALSPFEPKGFDYVMIMTNKFTKRTMTLVDKITYTTKDWTNILITALITSDWSIFRSIISDKDRKFMFIFWRTIFNKLNVSLLIFTTYHSQTNDQSERTNQTLKIAFRFWLFNSNNENWMSVLPYLIVVLNNFANVSTELFSNKLVYDFRVNDSLTLLENLSIENYNKFRQIKRDAAKKAIVFVNVMHKRRYDNMHFDVKLIVDDYAYIRLFADYTIFDLTSYKLSQQRVDSFKIFEKIDTLTYRLKLPSIMRIHLVISIT